MKRIDVWACDSDAAALSRGLLRLRCVDVEQVPAEGSIGRYDASERIRECERECDRIKAAMEALAKYDLKKKSFGKKPIETDPDEFVACGAAAEAEKTVDAVLEAAAALADSQKEISAVESRARALNPWLSCDLPLSFGGTDRTRVVLGTLPASVDDAALDEKLADLPAAYRRFETTGTGSQMMFVTVDEGEDLLLRRLNSCGFVRADFPALGEGKTAADGLADCDAELAALAEKSAAADEVLRQSAASLDDLRVLWDVTATSMEEAKLRDRLSKTDHCVILRGWVPEKKEEKVAAFLAGNECAYEISEPDEGDNVPVKLENNKFASCFEWVVAMYSLPAYGTYDPTFIMGICYIVLFALMLADAGYGLMLVLGGFLLPKLLGLNESTKKAFNMFGWCGVGCIITGVLFGGYFGDLPIAILKAYFPSVTPPESLALLVDPVLDPMTFLIIGLGAGVIHLLTAQAVNFSILWKNGQKVDAICDVALVWVLYASIVLFILLPDVGKWALIGAILLLIITGGRNEPNWLKKPVKGLLALYDLISFGSDIISYARILAIALSGTVLAQVFNILATMITTPVVGQVVMLVILLIGHVLNLALSALSGFVHTSRLQYIEFFGKFYTDGGKPYAPMLPSERFVAPKAD